jgi:ribosome recycling factor
VFKELTNLETTLRKSQVSAPSSTELQSISIDIFSQQSHDTTQTRIPLAVIDMNLNHNDNNHIEENACSYTSESTKKDRKCWRAPGTSNQMRNHARTLQKRALKKTKP